MDTPPTPPIYRPFAVTIGVCAISYSLIILGLAGYFMVGFYENDPQMSALLPAILLCLCISAVIIVPTLATVRLAWKTLTGTAKRSSAFWTVLFNLPILILGLFIIATKSLPFPYTSVIAFWAFIFLIFGIYILRAYKVRTN